MTSPHDNSRTQTLLMVPTAVGAGLTSACLGLIQALDYIGLKACFFKPFMQAELNGSGPDRSSALVARALNLSPPETLRQEHLERLLREDRLDDLLEEVIERHQQATEGQDIEQDIVVVEGLVPTEHSTYATQLNAHLAHALDARIIFVGTGDLNAPRELAEQLDMHARAFGGIDSTRTMGCILMRMKHLPEISVETPIAPGAASLPLDAGVIGELRRYAPALGTDSFHLIGVVPFSDTLSVPRVRDVAEAVGAKWLNEGDADSRRVLATSLCGRRAAHALDVFKPGSLIVTSGDRDDILLAAALVTMNGTPLAGVMLTNGYLPNEALIDACTPALKTGLPVMAVDTNSFNTVQDLSQMSNEIPVDDLERAEQVARFVAGHIDLEWLKDHLSRGYIRRLSPSAFRHQLVQKAQRAKKRIVLPEGDEPRTVEAAALCQRRGIAHCILLARREDVLSVAKRRGIELPEGLEIADPDSIRHRYVAPMVERRKGKLNEPMAEAQLQDNVVLGTMMLYQGEVDGLVSGAVHTTANTVRPAFQLIKTAPDYRLVSSIFFMLLPEQVLVYGDCAVNPDPNPEELAEIAIQSARSAIAFGIEPRVAMISYSTGESGSGSDVDKVREATRIARTRAPELLIDGPLQYDAAAIESVGKQKAPDSPVAGRATVFVFPDLNTGNTTYKAVQRSAKVVSVGPMLQGLNKPVNDLSRGALVDDIVYTIALTAIQAAQREATD